MKLGVLCLALVSVLGPATLAASMAACGNGDDDDANGAGDSGADATSRDATADQVSPALDAGDAADVYNDAAAHLEAGPDPAHTTGQTMTVQGAARTYDITVPLDCATTSSKVPLIIVLHGDGETGNDLYTTFGLEQAAATVGAEAVFVYPNGTNNVGASNNAWNLYDDPGAYATTNAYPPATPSGNNDVDYFDQMVTTFEKLACVDKRVFVTGISSGGYMSNQLARWRSTVVTGVAPMSGEPPSGNQAGDYPDCIGTTGPVPAFIIHGTADTVLTPDNGEQTASYWDMANECASAAADCAPPDAGLNDDLANPPATPTTATTPSPCVSSSSCTLAPVTFCLVEGLDHEIWSGAGNAIWSFVSVTGVLTGK